ncbi:Methylthioribulose-1-phosphate dehydratase [Aphelenchoides besseyi]|nr:Methylthioribulose-1-phosphate dehydratase [Aphelenchoides besseyi]
MVRRSSFWNYVVNKRCTLCTDRLSSTHASNIRKHFMRKHLDQYEKIMQEEPQEMPLKQNGQKREEPIFDFAPLENENSFPLLRMSNSTEFPPEEEDNAVVDFAFLLANSAAGGSQQLVGGLAEDNAQLISELMRQFYTLGWVYGSGGAMCIRNAEGFTFVTPSGVQKDRIKSEDIGMFDPQNQLIVAPAKPNVVSSCVNLFWTIFKTHEKQNPNRPLNAVIHTHSIDANLMASFLSQSYDHVRLSNEEMLKGIADRSTGCQLTNTQTCVIPVIENAPSESCPEFKERIERVMLENPNCSAILVRNHGAFYFGSSWEETKIMAEIFEYLFKLTLEKLRFAPQLADRIFRSK